MLKTYLYFEFLTLVRQLREWLYPVIFFFILMSMLPFAFKPDKGLLLTLFPGFLWIASIFANLLSAQQLFHADFEDDHMLQLLFADKPLAMLMTLKMAVYWCLTQLPCVCLVPLFGFMYGLDGQYSLLAAMVLSLGSIVTFSISALAYVLTLGLRQQGVLIAALFLPLLLPVIIFGVNILQQANDGFSIQTPFIFFIGLSLLSACLVPPLIAQILKFYYED